MTAMQVSANPYVAALGPPETASSRLNLAQAFNSLGTTIAPFFGSIVIMSAAPRAIEQIRQMGSAELQAYRLQEAASVKMPYLAIGLVLVALAISMAALHLPELASLHARSDDASRSGSIWKYRHLVLAAIGIFVYVGAEVSIGSFLVNYLSQPGIGNLPEKVAARYVSLYWGGAMVGRFVGSALLQRIRTTAVLGGAAVTACALVVISMLSLGHVAMWSIIAVGLFNSVMFPSIFTLGIEGLGALTSKGSGLLVAAIVGGAIVPEVQGMFADHIGIHHAFFVPAVCYVYIAWFAFVAARSVSPVPTKPVPVEPV
jgi:FHS family L-fucose permease-like MFS transporter